MFVFLFVFMVAQVQQLSNVLSPASVFCLFVCFYGCPFAAIVHSSEPG